MAEADARVVGGAVLGSLALGEGDRWSDLDLMFAVVDDVPVREVVEAWSGAIVREFGAVRLFDLPRGAIIYRVFLFPDCLELDLSFTPASEFGAGGARFKLLFGEAFEVPLLPEPPAEELFGYAVHHAAHARTCIERGEYWHAEFWISAVRDYALALACRRRDLDGSYGRDFDRLPPHDPPPASSGTDNAGTRTVTVAIRSPPRPGGGRSTRRRRPIAPRCQSGQGIAEAVTPRP